MDLLEVAVGLVEPGGLVEVVESRIQVDALAHSG